MKKHKILVVALAMAVMLVGSGYAYWTQSLTINNTVNTGELAVGFVCPTEVADWDDDYLWNNHSDRVTVDADRASNGQSIDFTVGNFYPGAGASLDFAIKNNGTVNAKVTQVTATNVNGLLCDVLSFEVTKVVKISTRDGHHTSTTYDIQDVKASSVTELASKLTEALNTIILEPEDVLILVADNPGHGDDEAALPGYNILMPDTIGGSDFEKTTGSFTLNLGFTQVN